MPWNTQNSIEIYFKVFLGLVPEKWFFLGAVPFAEGPVPLFWDRSTGNRFIIGIWNLINDNWIMKDRKWRPNLTRTNWNMSMLYCCVDTVFITVFIKLNCHALWTLCSSCCVCHAVRPVCLSWYVCHTVWVLSSLHCVGTVASILCLSPCVGTVFITLWLSCCVGTVFIILIVTLCGRCIHHCDCHPVWALYSS